MSSRVEVGQMVKDKVKSAKVKFEMLELVTLTQASLMASNST